MKIFKMLKNRKKFEGRKKTDFTRVDMGFGGFHRMEGNQGLSLNLDSHRINLK